MMPSQFEICESRLQAVARKWHVERTGPTAISKLEAIAHEMAHVFDALGKFDTGGVKVMTVCIRLSPNRRAFNELRAAAVTYAMLKHCGLMTETIAETIASATFNAYMGADKTRTLAMLDRAWLAMCDSRETWRQARRLRRELERLGVIIPVVAPLQP
jgi:hypothetical protein